MKEPEKSSPVERMQLGEGIMCAACLAAAALILLLAGCTGGAS